MKLPRRTARAIVSSTVAATALTACQFPGAASIPLPGGQGNGADAYQVTVEFSDVLDLVPQSAVKVNDVTVGSVQSIEATGFTARVVVSINGDVRLPENVTASVRQTSLLGEKFVGFQSPPPSEAFGRLRGGETIGLDRTTRSAEIEEVLSALSLVLNGGSLEQLQTINTELVKALKGRESNVKNLLSELDTFVGGLDAQKAQIVRALDSLDRLTGNLKNQKQVIATALDDIPGGVAVLTAQRADITRVLTSLDKLGDVAVRVINASQDNTVADLKALQPILNQLNAAGAALPNSLELLTTYPFPRTVGNGVFGDYANLFITLDANLSTIAGNTGTPVPDLPVLTPPSPSPGTSSTTTTPAVPAPAAPAAPNAPVLPSATPSPAPAAPLPGVNVPLSTSTPLLRLLLGGML